MIGRIRAIAAGALLLAVVMIGHAQEPAARYRWGLPSWLSPPAVPADNPMSDAKVELGRHLFYDTRLSGNRTQSCASCHQQQKAFTDGRANAIGSTGQIHPRGSMSLVNVAYAVSLTWANPNMTLLEDQALMPMYGDHPVELGLDRDDRWLEALRADRTYKKLFAAAFPAQALSADNVVKAIASFERTIVSARSPYDRYHFARDEGAMSEAARRGEALFHGNRLVCFNCHGGSHFSVAMGRTISGNPGMFQMFQNTGLYNLAGPYSYPANNLGLYEATHDPRDVGKFKPPTLRNIALTAPYMHDGSVKTLEEAIDHYVAGGRTIAEGENRGVGRNNPNKNLSIRGFALTPDDRADLIAFLESLTDQELLRDPRFSNPWPAARR